jgi:hypothetical protein
MNFMCAIQPANRRTYRCFREVDLTAALLRLNPEIKQRPELADEVIYKLRAILISVNQYPCIKRFRVAIILRQGTSG